MLNVHAVHVKLCEILREITKNFTYSHALFQKETKQYNLGAVAICTAGAKVQKTHVVQTSISADAQYGDVTAQLSRLFNVTDGTSLRVGQLKDKPITSFNGQDFATYLKSNGMYPSQVKVYLETSEKFAAKKLTPEAGDPMDAPATTAKPAANEAAAGPSDVGPSAKRKRTSESATEIKKSAPESVLLDIKDLEKLEQIGKGGMARVYRGTWCGMEVAIKQCEADTNRQAQQMADMMDGEIRIHVGLSHVNVLPMFGYARSGRDVMLVAELMDNALDKVLYPEEGRCTLTKKQKVFVIKEMLQ